MDDCAGEDLAGFTYGLPSAARCLFAGVFGGAEADILRLWTPYE